MQSLKVCETFDYLKELFGSSPKCELEYNSDVELLVAVILSAQCTDKRVNIVTKQLFKKYRNAYDFAMADVETLGLEIKSCGFYRNKARNIINMARAVVEDYDGVIPADLDKLVKLSGVGRKTANVFLSELYDVPAIAVDTHVIRVSGRLGFTKSKNPAIIEKDLEQLFDKENWGAYHYYLVLFGRYFCKAIKPQCEGCRIKKYCLKVKSE